MSDIQAQEAVESQTQSNPADDSLDAALKAAGVDDGFSIAPDAANAAESTDESKTSGPARDENGRFVSKKNDEAEPAANTEAEAKTESKYSDEDIKRAVAALNRDSSPKYLIDKLTSGDDDTIAYALKRAKVQADGDEFSNKHKTLQQELEALKSKPAANSGDTGKQDATASTPPLAKYLAEQLGDENAEQIVRESLAVAEQNYQTELAKRDQQFRDLAKKFEDSEIERNRADLLSEYPDLKDRDVWAKVRKQLENLPESEDRPDLRTRLEHAARIELAPELIKRAKSESDRRNKQRDNGNPTTMARAGETAPSMTRGELQDAMLDAQLANQDKRYEELKSEMHKRFPT